MIFSLKRNQFNGNSESELIAGRPAQYWLYAILAVGLLVRIAICFFTQLPNEHRDTIDYFGQAETLLQGGYTNFFPNGYPFIVALFKLVFGSYSETALIWLGIFMSWSVIYFCYDISRHIFRFERIALLAALIVAVFPSQINYARWLTTEVPTTFFLVGAYFFYYNRKHFWSGIFFGLATAVRTEILPILILLIILDAIWRRKFYFNLVIGALIPLLMVASYCYVKTGVFSLAGHGRINIILSVKASGSYIDWTYADQHPELTTSGKAVKHYFDQINEQPGKFIESRLNNLWELWGFFPSSAEEGRGIGSRLIIGAGNLFLVLFGLLGWWMNRKKLDAYILLLPFLVITGVHIVLFAMQRYTYPVEPFMIILAAYTLDRIFKFQKARTK